VVAVVLWLINAFVPINRTAKNIINFVIVILVIIWLLRAFGILSF
jgi:hypothetical protein